MHILELFAGSRSIGKVGQKYGHNVISSDIEQFGGIDYVVDVLTFDYNKIDFIPDMIWASPPCTGFSVASIGRHWSLDNGIYSPKSKTSELGLVLLRKTIEIIKYYQSKNDNLIWFIENPRGMMRKMPELYNYKRHTVTYCQYGDSRMKPTDIWTNSQKWRPLPHCKNGDPCHEPAPRGSSTGTQGVKGAFLRSVIPEKLCDEIIKNL